MELFDLIGRSGPKRLWRRGNSEKGLELWKNPDGKLFYKMHRTYEFKCPRCAEVNFRTMNWSLDYVKGVDPVRNAKKPDVKISCSNCSDPLTFTVDLGTSEYFGG
jgi:hypothetical protein